MIEDLRAAIADKQAVVFVGTGISLAASGSAVAGWKGFLRNGVDRVAELRGSSLPPGWVQRQKDALEDGDLDELLGVAEGVSRKLGAPAGGEFRKWLRDTIGSLTCAHPEIPRALDLLGVPLVTTNYDDILESVCRRRAINWRQENQVARFAQNEPQPSVLHLHGHWEDSESIILGVRSYEAIQAHPLTQHTLRSLLLTRTVIFVGYGAGLSDPNFEPLRKWSSSALRGTEHRHYRLCLRQEAQEIAAEHEEERIVPLVYGETYSELAAFLAGLARPSSPVQSPNRHLRDAAPASDQNSEPIDENLMRRQAWQALVGEQFEVTPLSGPAGGPPPSSTFRVKAVTTHELVLEKVSSHQEVAVPLEALDVPQLDGEIRIARFNSGKLNFVPSSKEWRYHR